MITFLFWTTPLFATQDDISKEIAIMAKALTYKTVSYDEKENRVQKPFLEFHQYLETSFPLVHGQLNKEIVNKLSLLYTWKGADPTLDPILLMGHMDVVPAPNEQGKWEFAPFSGQIVNDRIGGRGAFDDKLGVLSIMQAVENLLTKGFISSRTIYLAFGHDEEIGGHEGAEKIAQLLYKRGIKLASALDEGGGFLSDGIVMNIKAPIGVIGITEKGSMNIKLSVRFSGIAHSMAPPPETPVGILSRAIVKMEENPFPTRIIPVVGTFLESIANYLPRMSAFAVNNQWFLGGMVEKSLTKNPATNSLVRTVFSPNVIKGSLKANAIPEVAEAIFNVRILPGDTPESVLAYFIKTIDDSRVQIEKYTQGDQPRSPRPETTFPSVTFDLIVKAAKKTFPETDIYTPWMIPGGTDSRHYAKVTSQILGWRPFILNSKNKNGPHGIGEYITVDDYKKSIRFFERYIRLTEDAGKRLFYSSWESR